MKSSKNKTWTEKMRDNMQPSIQTLDKPYAGQPIGAVMLISTPREIESYIRQIPYGTSVKPETLRRDLAAAHHADFTCPLTTGIFLRILAEYNHEVLLKGGKTSEIAPFWRVIEPKMPVAQKLSFGKDFLVKMRGEEGIVQ
jgi:hypothetical protein